MNKPRMCLFGALVFLMLVVAWGSWLRRPVDRRLAPPRSAAIRIDVNRADADHLALLPGVGRELGRRIVEYRAEHGPFRSADDLLQVSGIGDRTLARIGPMITCAMAAP